MRGERAVVIGSGFGGLAAAVRLRARGHRVTVLEAMDQPGGRAAVFRRDGFTIDAGPTVITAPYLLDELFALVGRDPRDYFELVPLDPWYRIEFPGGSRFDYVGDEERLLAQIEAFEPRDVDGYRRLARLCERIFDVGYTRLSDVPFGRARDMLRVLPAMARLASHRSVYGQVSRFLRDERLRQVFSFQPLLVGGNPFRVTSIYLLIHWLERRWGVWFARGGTTSVVAGLARLLDELGVEVRLSTPAAEIEVSGRRATGVRTAAGEVVPASLVIANADPTHLYGTLLPRRARRPWMDAVLRTRRFSMGLFVGYFGTRRTYPGLAHHTLLLGPRYRELLRDIFDRRVLADDFSLYLHAPARTDPTLAPPGHECFYVLSPVPNLQGETGWESRGEAYFERILEALEARCLPGLRASIATRFHLTPAYFRDVLRSTHGAGFGIEPRLSQSAWFRFHNRSPDLDNLFLVGAGTHPGAGIPGVLSSARVLERVMPGPAVPEPVPAAGRAAVPA
jgi:phytoene desaturase